jgi:hypothetical protein
MQVPGLWAENLFGHYEHSSFVLENSPVKLLVGFSCACSGSRQTWTATLKSLKGTHPILQEFLTALREREQTPGTTWFAHYQARQLQWNSEMAWRDKIGDKIKNIEYQLGKKLSPAKRKKLKKKCSQLSRMLKDDTIARSTKLYQQMVHAS